MFLFRSSDLISHTSLVWSVVSFSILYTGRDSFVKNQVNFRPSLFANVSEQMICKASKGRWRLVQQVKKEHTINYGHIVLSFFLPPTWLIDNCTGVSVYLSICSMSISALQGMVQDASKEIAGHWYWNKAFFFARHFVTTSCRSKTFDLLSLDGVLVGVWIIIAVFDEAITCAETNGPNVG